MHRLTIFLMLAIIFRIGIEMFLGESSVGNLLLLRSQLDIIRSKNLQLANRNHQLVQKIIKLQTDNELIEEIAREYFGMINKDETLYILNKNN